MRNTISNLLTPKGRWLPTLLLLFTLGITQMWGTDYLLINGNDNASTATLNTVDYWTTQTLQTKSNGGDLKTCIITGGTVSKGVGNVYDPSKFISYGVKSTSTNLTIKVYNTNSSDLKINIYDVKEAANGTISSTVTEETVTKGKLNTINFASENAAGTKATIYITVPSSNSKIEFYQITASEGTTSLSNLKGGRVGYRSDYTKKGRLAAKGGTISMLDSIAYNLSGDYKISSSTYIQLKTNNYVKFKTVEPIVLTVDANNANKFYVATTAAGTTNEKASKAVHKIKLATAGDWYINGGASSATQINSISFSVPSISYDANGGEGSMSSNTWTVAANGFTAPSGKKFDGWKDGDNNVYTVGQEVLEDVTLYAQWKVDAPEYTVTYKDGTTELKSVNVAVGSAPDAYSPTKDCYTFAAWQKDAVDYDPANLASDAAANQTYTLTARWTSNYFTESVDFEEGGSTAVSGVASKNIVASNAGSYDGGKASENWAYKGWKIKSDGATVKVLVRANKKVTFKFGYLAATGHVAISGDETNYSVTGASKVEDDPLKFTTYSWTKNYDALYTFTTGSGDAAVIKALTVQDTYTATRVDGKSDGAGTDPNVLETTLPTPTAISGWAFTGWVANQDVKAGEDTKTAGTVLAAGTYTLLANTTFTAQWAEASSTYDITYVSAHGTAPAADNAASVVLAELSADGWAHKGWTADVDVTVDAATVEAGTLIANGKTVILASNVTFTAVWKEIFTVTFDSKDGSAVAPVDVEDGATLAAAPEDPTKDDYVFQGWSETDGGPVVADITAITISDDKTFYAIWKLDVQVSEIVFSNSFKGWIHDGQVEVFYMAGESAPTITSYAGKNLKDAEDAVAISGDKVIATGTDNSQKEYALTMTAVTPLTATGAQTFDGTEGYVKTRHAWTADRKWKMSKYAEDGRVAQGNTSMYIFLGPAESVTLDWGAQKVTNDVAVYVNGTFVKNIGKNNNSAIALSNGNNMVAMYSLQTSGDIWLDGLTVAPWVPVTAVALKEGENEISSKSIWESTNFTLTAEVTPDNASNKTITWTSDDETVATVVNGVVTGESVGTATITASTVDGVNATCVVTVTEAPSPCETPVVTADPANVAYCAGNEPTLTVAANDPSDGGTLHYAWFKEAGETDEAVGTDAASYTVEAAGTYYVIVTNKKEGKFDASVTSANAVVTLNVAAAITKQPANKRDIALNSEVTLSVEATNATGYQWYSCDDAEKHNAVAISGAEAANYVFTCNANGFYYCVVGNACGEDITSNVVSVKLEPKGCNLVGTPSGNAYTLVGEWSIYPVNSNGQHNPEGTDFGTCKAFDEETDVNCVNTRRFAIKFEKDVESVTIYARGGTDRTFDKVSVADEMAKNAYTELTDITKQLVTIDGAGKEYIATAEGMIPGGKYAWFDFSGSFSGVFKICYTTALVEPKLPTLSNQELCASAPYETFDATITNAAACEGTVSYKWYSTANTESPVATTATFTPSEDGEYYVKVTHAAAGHITRTVQSANLSVAHFDALAMVSHSDDVFQHMGTETTLSVVATGKNVAYVWYTCSNAAGDDAVAITPAETESSLTIASVAEGVQYYKVVISHDCDATTLSHVFKVEGWNQLEQVDVTATTTWDMTNVSANAINLADMDPSQQNVRLLLANIDGVNNNASFNSQALKFEGQHIGRTSNSVKHLAGRYLEFNTTIPGIVSVTFASNGDDARKVRINNAESEETSGTSADKYITFKAYVDAGTVQIMGMEGSSENEYLRFKEVVFTAADESRANLQLGGIGTVCLPFDVATTDRFGGTFYKADYQGPGFAYFLEETGTLQAGIPYVYVADTTFIVLLQDANANTVTDPTPYRGMYGTFTDMAAGSLTDKYVIAQKKLRRCGAGATLAAYRAYIDLTEMPTTPLVVNDPVNAPVRRRLGIGGNNGSTTDLQNYFEFNAEGTQKVIMNGQLYILRDGKMYNAQGQLMK